MVPTTILATAVDPAIAQLFGKTVVLVVSNVISAVSKQ